MAKTPLNKAELTRRKRQLATFQRFLPSLEMKRKQLLAARTRERRALDELRQRRRDARDRAAQALPMLADTRIPLDELVTIDAVDLGEQNLVGVALPTVREVRLRTAPYGYLAMPHWVDDLAAALREQLDLNAREQVAEARLARIEEGVRTVTKRVNLFDKILIPRSKREIQRIEIALADAERAGVVRAKIAKRKRAEVAA